MLAAPEISAGQVIACVAVIVVFAILYVCTPEGPDKGSSDYPDWF